MKSLHYSYDVMAARTTSRSCYRSREHRAGRRQGCLITNAFDGSPPVSPVSVSITWFNLVKETDWRVQSSAASLRAFSSGLQKLDATANKCAAPVWS